MQKSKRIWKMVFRVILIIFITMGFILAYEFKELKELDYTEIDMFVINNGTYRGNTSTLLVKATVDVTVEDNKIIKVDIVQHKHGMGEKAEDIVIRMKEQNSYNVDVISGATISSEVIKNATNKALKKGMGSSGND